MTSTINTAGINASFPVAGVDNNSQGFRDNFQSIKNQLEIANTEITDLQASGVKVNDDNYLNGNVLEDFVALQEKYQTYNIGSTLGTVSSLIDWQNGSYQTVTTSSANGVRTFGFTNFGTAGSAARLTLEVNLVATGSNKITFNPVVKYAKEYSASVTVSAGSNFAPDVITVNSAGGIQSITVGAGGTGYTDGSPSVNTVTILAGNGFGAAASATVSSGAVTGFTINSSGGGYGNSPMSGYAALNPGRHIYEFVTTDVGATIYLVNYKFFPA